MARPDLVPPLADIDVITALTPDELDRCWIWVATPRHVEKPPPRSTKLPILLLGFRFHNKANIGRSTEDSVAAMPDAVRIAREVGGAIQLCIATAFTCPFEGLTDPERVIGIAADPRTDGADDIVVCDTIGQAVPTQVADLILAVRSNTGAPHRLPRPRHLGQGVANTLAAIDAGAAMVDGSSVGSAAARCARRQRQHLHRGSAVRHPTGLVHPDLAGVDGGSHRQDARRDRRTEPLTNRPGRSLQSQGLRLGYRMNRIKTTDAGRALSPDLRGITGMIGPAGGE